MSKEDALELAKNLPYPCAVEFDECLGYWTVTVDADLPEISETLQQQGIRLT